MRLLIPALLLFAGLATSAAPADLRPATPNLLFIFSDDHSCQSIGAYRMWLSGFIREQNSTPNIDRLADQAQR